MSYVPANVKKLMKENNQIAAAAEHSHSLRVGNITAGWHEKDFKGPVISPNEKKDAPTSRAPYIAEKCQSCVKQPIKKAPKGTDFAKQNAMTHCICPDGVAKLARQERLKELYAEEARAYEQELQAMGLALLKPRD
eukprot:1159285-Pelagomonas_calceolata.AAC.1